VIRLLQSWGKRQPILPYPYNKVEEELEDFNIQKELLNILMS